MHFIFALQHPIPPGIGMPREQRWRAMLVLLLAIAMASLDTAIANVALPAMARDLHVIEANAVWIISAYQLAMVALLLPVAALGEIVGHRRILFSGLVLFTLASLACGLAPSLGWLVVARVVQGLAAAGVMAVNGALLRFIYSDLRIGHGIGLSALVVALAFAAGPTVASIILTFGSWPWLFFINVPVGLIATFLCLRTMPPTPRSQRPFDGFAAILCASLLGLLVLILNEGAQQTSWHNLLVMGGAAIFCLLVLLRRQAGHAAPFLALDLLRLPIFALSAVTGLGAFATQSLAFVALPFLLQSRFGYTQVETGFLITPWPVLVAIIAPMTGRLASHVEPGILAGIGLAVLALGMALLAMMPAQPASVFGLCWRLALCGIGFGFFQSPNSWALITAAPPERSGSASGMSGTVRLLGQSVGAALVAACFHVSTEQGAIIALWLGVIFSIAGSAVSLMRIKYRSH